MPESLPCALALTLFVAGLGAGCHRRVDTKPVPVPSTWEHCWWTVLRSALPSDSVAARFRRAFANLGLTGMKWTRSGDTTWVRAGPSSLERGPAGAMYWSRVVTFPLGDTTHFRYYVAIVPPAGGWARPSDAGNLGRHHIEFCGDIANESAVRLVRRPGDPGDEERLPVWTRVP